MYVLDTVKYDLIFHPLTYKCYLLWDFKGKSIVVSLQLFYAKHFKYYLILNFQCLLLF